VDHQQEFIQVGAINAPRVVSEDFSQTLPVDLIFPFELGPGQQFCVRKKIVWGHGHLRSEPKTYHSGIVEAIRRTTGRRVFKEPELVEVEMRVRPTKLASGPRNRRPTPEDVRVQEVVAELPFRIALRRQLDEIGQLLIPRSELGRQSEQLVPVRADLKWGELLFNIGKQAPDRAGQSCFQVKWLDTLGCR
jgi:hypothetical protein